MSSVPPMHFQMKFTIPAVHRQPRFLRGHGATALYSCEILRQNNSPFQLFCTRISRPGKINGSAREPKTFPCFDTAVFGFFKTEGGYRFVRRKKNREAEF